MKRIILTILLLAAVCFGAKGQIGYGIRISPDTAIYGKQPKNDTVKYAIEILNGYNSFWIPALAVRKYELQYWESGMNAMSGYRPVVQYFIGRVSKVRIASKILRSVEQ